MTYRLKDRIGDVLRFSALCIAVMLAVIPAQAQNHEGPIQGTIKVERGDDFEALAQITEAQARTAAESALSGSEAHEAELEEEDGYLVYAVDATRDGDDAEVLVDAGDASVLAIEHEDDEAREEEDAYTEERDDENDEEGEAAGAKGGETALSVRDLPAAVRQAFEATYPDAQIIGTARENKGGETYYEVESRDGSTRRDLLYRPNGDVYEVETTIAASTLPAPVRDALEQGYPDTTVEKVERIERNGDTLYGVQVMQNGTRHEIVFTPNGEIIE